MLRINTNAREKYRAIDPYFKQSTLQDVPNLRYETSREEYEMYHQPKDDYSILGDTKFRYKREETSEPSEELTTTLSSTITRQPIVYEKFLTPLYVITGFFAAMLVIGPLLVRKGPNRGLIQSCIMLSAFCMWIFWFTIYFGQMNPLMGPRLENTTVAWIAYKLGKPFSPRQ